MTNGTKRQNEIFYAVKGHLIPLTYSSKDIESMYNSYFKRLWNNHERLVNCQPDFEDLWKCNIKDTL